MMYPVKQELKDVMAEVAKRWDYSGHFIVYRGEESLLHGYYGYEHRLEGTRTSAVTRYLMDSKERFFVGLAILMAVDEKLLDLSMTIENYLPEWPHGDRITLEDLLRGQSGLEDFYHGHLMVEIDETHDNRQLTTEELVRKERSLLYENRTYKRVYEIMEGLPLAFEPGTNDAFSETNVVLLDEIIRRQIGMTTLDFLKRHLFIPYDFQDIGYDPVCHSLSYLVHQRKELVAVPMDFAVEGLFSIRGDSALKLMDLIRRREILSKDLWEKILTYDEKGQGILFSNANGYDVTSTQFLGFGLHLYFDFNRDLCFASLINEDQTFKIVDNVWRYFRRDAREAVSAVMTYPIETKMVPVNEKNFWDALSLTVRQDQQSFVMDAKGSLAMGLFYKTKEVYVQMEGEMVVGLLVLDVDPKKDFYHISIIIIDQKFQNKGFGQVMVNWAVAYLKEAGAKKLTIGVNRDNMAAKKVYMKAGFSVKSVYDGGMELEMIL